MVKAPASFSLFSPILPPVHYILFKTKSPAKDKATLSDRQTPICKTALLLSMIIWKNPDRMPRNDEIGVKIQIMETNTVSVNHPYQ